MSWPAVLLALAAAAALCSSACGAVADRSDGAGTTEATDDGGDDMEDEVAGALSALVGVPASRLTVRLCPHSPPGLAVFTAFERGGPEPEGWTGTYDGGLELDLDANLERLAGAWEVDDEREIDPVAVASCVGMLQHNPGLPLLDAEQIELEGFAAPVAPPSLTRWEGDPAVEFWNRSTRRGPARTLAVFRSDGSLSLVRPPGSQG